MTPSARLFHDETGIGVNKNVAATGLDQSEPRFSSSGRSGAGRAALICSRDQPGIGLCDERLDTSVVRVFALFEKELAADIAGFAPIMGRPFWHHVINRGNYRRDWFEATETGEGFFNRG